MTKTPTDWQSNTDKSTGLVAYSDPNTAYSDPLVSYSSPNVGLDEFNQLASLWNNDTKVAAIWEDNPAAHTNEYLYDSIALYNSLLTYDGVGSDLEPLNTNSPTLWSDD